MLFVFNVFDQIAILAPGLLGASVARAARHYGAAKRLTLWARRPEARLQLKDQPWCDAVADTPADAVRGAQFVVICAPVDQIVALVQQIAPTLAAGTIVTDVGSVKGEICRLSHKILGGRVHFVGSHPMAGSEKTGWEHGRAAHISHLPQVLASTLCACLNRHEAGWRNYAGGGLRDTTRIAGSDPRLWKTILEQNRDEILRAVRGYQDELHGLERALANRDWFEVQAILERGKGYRDQFRLIP